MPRDSVRIFKERNLDYASHRWLWAFRVRKGPTHQFILAALISGVSALFLVACNGVGDEENTATIAYEQTSERESTLAQPAPTSFTTGDAVDEAALRVFRMPYRSGVKLDPGEGDFDFTASWVVFQEIYAGLMHITGDPNERVQPDMAKRYVVSGNGLEYHFELRRDLRFSDGTPVSASDFKWSWERALNPATASINAANILGPIEGADEVISGETTELSGVEVIDDRNLSVRLKSPRSDFIALLAQPAASVLKRANVAQWPKDWMSFSNDATDSNVAPPELPVGTGPFKIVEYDFDGNIVLERNDFYHHGPVMLDRVELLDDFGVLSQSDRLATIEQRFAAQGIDAYWGFPSDDDFDESTDSPADRKLVYVEIAPETGYLMFNTDLEPYDEIEFRHVLAATATVEDWNVFFGDTKPTGIIPDGLGIESAVDYTIHNDPEWARSVAETSKHSSELDTIEINHVSNISGVFDDFYVDMSEAWATELGIEASYSTGDFETYQRLIDANEIEMRGIYSVPNYPDPHALMVDFVNPFAQPTLESHAVNRDMIIDAVEEQDVAERANRYAEIEETLVGGGIVIPLFWLTGELVWNVQPWVNGFAPQTFYGSIFRDVWFDEQN